MSFESAKADRFGTNTPTFRDRRQGQRTSFHWKPVFEYQSVGSMAVRSLQLNSPEKSKEAFGQTISVETVVDIVKRAACSPMTQKVVVPTTLAAQPAPEFSAAPENRHEFSSHLI